MSQYNRILRAWRQNLNIMVERPLKTTTRFPDLAFGKMKQVSSNRTGWIFAIDIQFGEQALVFRRPFLLGLQKARIYVALRAANITFALTDCICPNEDWEYNREIETIRTVWRRAINLSTAAKEIDKKRTLRDSIGIEAGDSTASLRIGSSDTFSSQKTHKDTAHWEIEDQYEKTGPLSPCDREPRGSEMEYRSWSG